MKKRICLSWLHPEALFVQMAKVRNLIETFCVVFYQITAVKLIKLIRSGPSTRPPRKADESPFITKCSLTHSNYAPERQIVVNRRIERKALRRVHNGDLNS
jgi:hypothetical protein